MGRPVPLRMATWGTGLRRLTRKSTSRQLSHATIVRRISWKPSSRDLPIICSWFRQIIHYIISAHRCITPSQRLHCCYCTLNMPVQRRSVPIDHHVMCLRRGQSGHVERYTPHVLNPFCWLYTAISRPSDLRLTIMAAGQQLRLFQVMWLKTLRRDRHNCTLI